MMTIRTPFAPLIHSWEKLQCQATQYDSDLSPGQVQAQCDLQNLLEAIQGSPELADYFKMRESSLVEGLTSYHTMWTLFAPGELVYARPFLDCPQLFIVESPPSIWDSENGIKSSVLNVDCWCYDWNGFEMVRVYYNIAIERFKGTKPILELACYPVRNHQSRDELFARFVRQGRLYERIVKSRPGASQMFCYTGKVLSHDRDFMGRNNEDTV
jgi:hypothetical protein